MGLIGKIKFEQDCNMSFVSNFIATILTGTQCNSSRVVLSFCFRELALIDKILTETDIEYIEGFTWEEFSSIESFFENDYINNILSINIISDKFQIFISLLDVNTLPENFSTENREHAFISIRKQMTPKYSLQEENKAKEQLLILCKQIFIDVSTLHFCSSHDNSGIMNFVIANMKLPFVAIHKNLLSLLTCISPNYLCATYRISINRDNMNNVSCEFIRKFENRPTYIYLPDGGWNRGDIYNMPFAVNSQRTLYPICNCNWKDAFKFAQFAQENLALFRNFSLFLPNIAWKYDNGISCTNPSNQIMLDISKNGLELTINYEQYKDSDPPLKRVRDLINTVISKYNILFHNAKPVICKCGPSGTNTHPETSSGANIHPKTDDGQNKE